MCTYFIHFGKGSCIRNSYFEVQSKGTLVFNAEI